MNESSVFARPGFKWDEQDAYLFDIDGTLLRCRDHIHVESFIKGIRAATGRDLTLDGVVMSGNTDPGILHDAFQLSHIEPAQWQPQMESILTHMRTEFASRRSEMCIDKMPGVDEVLARLDRRGATLGVATGNLEAIGWIKLEILHLRHWFAFGGFSDRFLIRADMIAHAAAQARALTRLEARLCVIGDTPADIAAARANDIPVLAVATGRYSFEQLMGHAPDACAIDFPALLASSQS